YFFFFQAEDGIRDFHVTGVQTCALPICEKPKIKCADCPNRRFLQVTDEVVSWHLSGRDTQCKSFVMGIYPMLQDETCFFLAADRSEERRVGKECRVGRLEDY